MGDAVPRAQAEIEEEENVFGGRSPYSLSEVLTLQGGLRSTFARSVSLQSLRRGASCALSAVYIRNECRPLTVAGDESLGITS